MSELKRLVNWIRWCWKLKEWVPLNVGYVKLRAQVTRQDIDAAQKFLDGHPELAGDRTETK